MRYSERARTYINAIRLIMRVNALQVLDAARLDADVTRDPGGPDA